MGWPRSTLATPTTSPPVMATKAADIVVKIKISIKTKPRKKTKFPGAVKNILAILNLATAQEVAEGTVWYTEAHHFCLTNAERFGLRVEVVAGIVSALSPATDWERNKSDALQVLLGNRSHGYGTYGPNVEKAFRIRDTSAGEDISGFFLAPKTFNFYHNIVNPNAAEFVTIDRHALSVAMGATRADKAVKLTEYRELTKAYKKAADKAGLLPADLQAITWCVWRNRKGYKSKFTLADILARETVHVF
jgi:hypothetical protein